MRVFRYHHWRADKVLAYTAVGFILYVGVRILRAVLVVVCNCAAEFPFILW